MLNSERILIIDDSPEVIWPLVDYLEKEYEVFYATTPAKGLHLARSEKKPSLILLDIMMPEMDGYQVFSSLRADLYTKEIPIIFLTSRNDEVDELKALELGAQDFIKKPYNLQVVRERIKSVLSLRRELERRNFLKKQLEGMNEQLQKQVSAKKKELFDAQELLDSYETRYSRLFKEHQKEKLPKVLVVDDNPDNIQVLLELLEGDYQLFFAKSGSKALEIANSSDNPDAILLDVMMPDMDGYEVCARLKAVPETRDIPVIFITALDQEMDETKGLSLGAVDFINKPFSLSVVQARLKTALRLKEEMDSRLAITARLQDLNENLEDRVSEKTSQLKKAHETLSASEERYRTLYETAIEGIFEATSSGRILSASPSFARMLGYKSSQELVSTVTNAAGQLYVNPNDRNSFKTILERDGQIFHFETLFKKKNGTSLWVSISAKLVYSEEKKTNYYQGFIIDISDQKRAQFKRDQHLQELQLLNKIISLSILQTTTEDILLSTCLEILKTFKLPHVAAFLFNSEQTEARLIEPVTAQLGRNKTPLSLADNTEIQPISLKNNASIAQLVQVNSPAITTLENELKLLVTHLAAPENLIYSSALLAPLINDDIQLGLLVLLATTPDCFSEEKINLTMSIASQLAGALTRIQLHNSQKKLERQYYQAQKMEAVGTLTSGVAHDFNNILTVIFSVSDLLKIRAESGGTDRQLLDQLRSAAGRAASLVRQLLAFSRQQVLEPKNINLNDVLSRFEKMLVRVIGENIELKTVFDPDLGIIHADIGQMEQVFMNLSVNARDAMPKGGYLTIETTNVILDEGCNNQHVNIKPGSYVVVTVRDSGVGIDMESIPHIFDPFFTTKPKGKGTGLGLSTVHGIIHQSGGHITVHSKPGHGTCFKIYFPIISEREIDNHDRQEEEHTPEVIGGTETILVVEDDKTVCKIVSNTLQQHGYKTLVAHTAETAMQIINDFENQIDLLLTDVLIPGQVDGVELSKKILLQYPLIKVIYMSGYTDNAFIQQGLLSKEVEFIKKPFIAADMARKVRAVLDKPKV